MVCLSAKRAGLTFLSDLHYKPYWPDIYDALKEMEAEDYTLEAVSYTHRDVYKRQCQERS